MIVPPIIENNRICLLLHGLNGLRSDFDYLVARIQQRDQSVRLLVPPCNEGKTKDGIDTGGNRVFEWLMKEIGNDSNTYRLSIIGHSLGGMYARYVACKLYQLKFLDGRIIPDIFVTLATPHLGSRQQIKVYGQILTKIATYLFLGQTGRQLFLQDDDTLLLRTMADGDFIEALRCFDQCILYANVNHDYGVHYCTSAIRAKNILRHHEGAPAAGRIVDENNDMWTKAHEQYDNHQPKDPIVADLVKPMRKALTSLKWARFAVQKSRRFFAHTDIIVKSSWMNKSAGSDVVDHLINQMFRKQ